MWRPLGCADSERFALVWETEELKALNNTLYSFVKNKVQTKNSSNFQHLLPSELAKVQFLVHFCHNEKIGLRTRRLGSSSCLLVAMVLLCKDDWM